MSRRSRWILAALAAGFLLLLLSLPAAIRLTADGRALEAARVSAVVEEAVAHGPGQLTVEQEGRHLALHLARSQVGLLRSAGLGEAVPLRFRLPPGLRLERVEGDDPGGVSLCRGFQCPEGEGRWVRWVLRTAGAGASELWVTVARSGEFDVRLRKDDGTFTGPLVLPAASARGH